MRLTLLLTAAAVALTACGQQQTAQKGQVSGGGGARTQVWAAGSSTVFPFATRVAETVARTTGGSAAKVESLGTGGGIKLFCSGTGAGYPDIATASRAMKKSEFEACQANGVTEIVELKIGFDGIVLANAKASPTFDISREQIYRALAAEVPQGSGFAPNTAATWSAVAPGLPNTRILAYGPPPTSGTRDAFVELAMEKGAEKVEAMAALKKSNEDEFKAKAHTLRRDGAWVDSGENDNAIVQTLEKTPNAVGVFGYSFLENNMDKVKAAAVEGVAPTFETISSGQYPLSRSLYIYVKKANVGVTPGLREYVNAFVSDAAAGKGGYLQQRGLISLPAAEHDQVKAAAQALTPMAAPAK
ncbi:substrate-binding domain-containing protein [Phenylobacterium sp.]|jgi:phosphate transport system substrate-binding protein|uniref:substrate-binding domain-containing protein n=1 Tax=Phenylobacterium sp. TaxID=1871053 RepID=UPI002F92B420